MSWVEVIMLVMYNVALCHTPYGVSHCLESLPDLMHTPILCVAFVALPVTAGQPSRTQAVAWLPGIKHVMHVC